MSMCCEKYNAMRSIGSATCSARTAGQTQHHKCGQGRFLRGSALALWLLPELDSNQQPCD